MGLKIVGLTLLVLTVSLLWCPQIQGQVDTVPETKPDTFFLLKYKGLLGKLAQNILVDTASGEPELQRNDKRFLRYEGRPIRNIIIQTLEFGTPISDTTTKLRNTLINISNSLHRQTRKYIIRRNLFFKEREKLVPFLVADNERHLREQPYFRDARIFIRPAAGMRDSIDVFVVTKDVLPYGGSFNFSSFTRMEAAARNDNFLGWGDRLQIRGLFDMDRSDHFGYGAEYISRNIAGTFIDGTLGFNTAAPTMNTGRKEEVTIYAGLVKPLVHPYMRWTYALEAGYHNTQNMFVADSFYRSDFRYAYTNLDAWAGYNMQVNADADNSSEQRLRTLLGLRVLEQKFSEIPLRYENEYFFRYTDVTAVLGSLSIFRQDFYKTRYIYGFGRTEDVPEGIDVSLTTGWTQKQGRPRGYTGLDMQLNYFSAKNHYFDYTLRLGGFTRDQRYEDIDLFVNMNYFTDLRKLGSWRQRTFISANVTAQFNTVINEPLFLQSRFAMPEFRSDSLLGGNFRSTLKAESVFFNNWSLASFRFAPFVFAHGTWLDNNTGIDKKFFTSIGGGLRTRNESLIFGTLEFRAFYFPGRNLRNEYFRFEFATNLRFTYRTATIRKPEFIVVN